MNFRFLIAVACACAVLPGCGDDSSSLSGSDSNGTSTAGSGGNSAQGGAGGNSAQQGGAGGNGAQGGAGGNSAQGGSGQGGGGTAAIAGTFVDGNTITINGTGFGSNGPDYVVEFFDGGSAGQVVTTANSEATAVQSTPSFYTAEHLSKGSSAWFDCAGTNADRVDFSLLFGSFNEVYVQYAFKVPTGMNFPGATTPQTFPTTVSPLKALWLIDNTSANGDLCAPSYNQARFNFAGNDIVGPWPWRRVYKEAFSWTGFSTVVFAAKADPVNPATANGWLSKEWWSNSVASSPEAVPHIHSEVQKPVFAGTSGSTTWKRAHVNSWCTSGKLLYDQFYMAAGANANARVIVTDNATLADATRMAIQPDLSWSNTTITVTANVQDFSNESAHFFVIPAGYPETPIYIGSLMAP